MTVDKSNIPLKRKERKGNFWKLLSLKIRTKWWTDVESCFRCWIRCSQRSDWRNFKESLKAVEFIKEIEYNRRRVEEIINSITTINIILSNEMNINNSIFLFLPFSFCETFVSGIVSLWKKCTWQSYDVALASARRSRACTLAPVVPLL